MQENLNKSVLADLLSQLEESKFAPTMSRYSGQKGSGMVANRVLIPKPLDEVTGRRGKLVSLLCNRT